jgi:hypothetical protein
MSSFFFPCHEMRCYLFTAVISAAYATDVANVVSAVNGVNAVNAVNIAHDAIACVAQ